MNYISIKELKNKAKKKRKSNTSIKNHSESLDIVAKEYNYSNWQELIENSILPIKEKNKSDELKNQFIEFVHSRNKMYEALNSKNIKEFEKIFTNVYLTQFCNKDAGDSIWRDRSLFLLKTICSQLQYIENVNFKDFKELFNLNNLINLSKKHKTYESTIISNYFIQILVNNIEHLNNENYSQHGYLSMQFFQILHNIELLETLFSDSSIKINDALLEYEKNPYNFNFN